MKDAVLLLMAALLMGVADWKSPLMYPVRCQDIPVLKMENPLTTAMMDLRRREAAKGKKKFTLRHKWVSLQNISPVLRDAVLSAEDDRFYYHHGVEWGLMKKALVDNWTTGRRTRGASTITQQLAKNLYFSPKKSYLRKGRELIVTFQLEKELPKKRIFEIYLNVAEWGDGIFGAEAAARAYFGKSASDLTLDEAAALAAVLPNPRKFSPLSASKWVTRRKAWVLRRMRQNGKIPTLVESPREGAGVEPLLPEEEPLLPMTEEVPALPAGNQETAQ